MPETVCPPLPTLRATFVACAVYATALCAPGFAPPTQPSPTPLEIRATFLLNLARFVRWPGTASSEPGRAFVIGYFPADPIAAPLRQLVEGESTTGRPIEMRELRRRDDFARCNLVYLGDTFSPDAIRALAKLRTQSVLFVGNNDRLLPAGGHVQFVQQGDQVRLRISPENLRVSRLVPDSQLLRVATTR